MKTEKNQTSESSRSSLKSVFTWRQKQSAFSRIQAQQDFFNICRIRFMKSWKTTQSSESRLSQISKRSFANWKTVNFTHTKNESCLRKYSNQPTFFKNNFPRVRLCKCPLILFILRMKSKPFSSAMKTPRTQFQSSADIANFIAIFLILLAGGITRDWSLRFPKTGFESVV